MSAMDEEIEAYAAAVRAALADVPEPDRETLLADLEQHLTEVAAESDPTPTRAAAPAAAPALAPDPGSAGRSLPPGERLVVRLGSPEAYAAELRAAYGVEAPGRGRRSMADLRALVLSPAGRSAVAGRARDLVGEFQPTWWLIRGYLLVIALWRLEHRTWATMPGSLLDVFVLVAVIAGSVALGLRTRRRGGFGGSPFRAVLAIGNVALAGLLLALPSVAGVDLLNLVSPASATPDAVAAVPADRNAETGVPSLANIFPYSRDGKPLSGVLLYDESGKPITLSPEDHGLEVDQPCDGPPPIANAFPLRLRDVTEAGPETEEETGRPECAPITPSPAPRPSRTPGG